MDDASPSSVTSLALALLLLPFSAAKAQGGWSATTIPPSGRYDDVFFVNADTGWAAGGSAGTIFKTMNGGGTWSLQFDSPYYLRSIEFVNDTLGFCGSLEQSLYRTTDGGATWTDISASIQPPPYGICGLSAPGGERIYGCGIWSSPAYIIRSDDHGGSWTYMDMSDHAQALVDIHFISADTGFATGTSHVPAEGGMVLRTTNGGASWQTVHTTGVPGDIIWKIQVLDDAHCYGSVYGVGVQQDTRMIRSVDGGLSWETRVVADHYTYTEGMGFIDDLRGWVGGDQELFSTTDGGDTWTSTTMGHSHNRFFRIDGTLAYFSGGSIYKYSEEPTGMAAVVPDVPAHQLDVRPTMDGGGIDLSVRLARRTTAVLELLTADGRLVERLMFDRRASGSHHFVVAKGTVPQGVLLVVLRTNEGLISRRTVNTL